MDKLCDLIFFGMLCLVSARESESLRTEAHRCKWLDRWMPVVERGSAGLAMLFAAILGTVHRRVLNHIKQQTK